MNAANTSMLVHSGRLMALWEGGSALAVDPETLDAGDFVIWRPDLAGLPFSAHPKSRRTGRCGISALPRGPGLSCCFTGSTAVGGRSRPGLSTPDRWEWRTTSWSQRTTSSSC